MKFQQTMAFILSAFLLSAPSIAMAQAPGPAQMPNIVMPVAAGALVGAAATFFVLPLIVPSAAVVGAAGTTTTASPFLAAIGAGVGGFIAYELMR